MVQGRAGCSRQSLVQGPLEPAWQHAGSLHLPDHEHETHLRHYRRLVGRDVLGEGCKVEGGMFFFCCSLCTDGLTASLFFLCWTHLFRLACNHSSWQPLSVSKPESFTPTSHDSLEHPVFWLNMCSGPVGHIMPGCQPAL